MQYVQTAQACCGLEVISTLRILKTDCYLLTVTVWQGRGQ
jgi:hypothetical protein